MDPLFSDNVFISYRVIQPSNQLPRRTSVETHMTTQQAGRLPWRSRFGRAPLAAGAAGLGMLALASCAAAEPEASPPAPVRTPHSAETRTPSPTVSVYADGTYTASGEYQSPSGRETIGVTITLVHDVVTDVMATPEATDPQARVFQKAFSSGIAAVVVGRDIADLHVSRVSGSSLTGAGFNAALEQIRSVALQ